MPNDIPTLRVVHPLPRARDWQDRPEFDRLCAWWRKGGVGVCALIGIGGAGKTAMADRFVRVLPGELLTPKGIAKDTTLPAPRSLFVYSFYRAPNAESFFGELYSWLSDSPFDDTSRTHSCQQTLQLLIKVAQASSPAYSLSVPATSSSTSGVKHPKPSPNTQHSTILLVLDGLEKVQDDGARGGALGQLLDGRLRDLILRVADGWLPGVALLFTSRFRLFDAEAQRCERYHPINVEELRPDDACKLLDVRGVKGPDAQLLALARENGFHALTLDLLGGYVSAFCDGDPARLPPLAEIKVPDEAAAEDPRLAAVKEQERKFGRLAQRYREALTTSDPAALALLERVCLFRLGVNADTLVSIFTGVGKAAIAGADLAKCGPEQVEEKLKFLRRMRLLEAGTLHTDQIMPHAGIYSVHPAVREGFLKCWRLTVKDGEPGDMRSCHLALVGHYDDRLPVKLAELNAFPKQKRWDGKLILSILDQFEELIHHLLCSDRWADALTVYRKGMGESRRLERELGEYSRGERITRRLVATAPSSSSSDLCRLLNNQAGFSRELGDLPRALKLYLDAEQMAKANLPESARELDVSRRNLAYLMVLRGELGRAERLAQEQLDELAADRNALDEHEAQLTRLVCELARAEARGLRGVRVSASIEPQSLYELAQQEESELYSATAYGGVWLVDLLLRFGESEITPINQITTKMATYANSRGWDAVRHWLDLAEASIALVENRFEECGRRLDSFEEWCRAQGEKRGQIKALTLRIPYFRLSKTSPFDYQQLVRLTDDAIKETRLAGFGIYHIDMLLERARLHLLGGQPKAALDDVRIALDDGWPPEGQSSFPTLLAATDPECGYAWGIAEGRHLRAQALLLQAALTLGRTDFVPGRFGNLPAEVRSLIESARAELDECIQLRKRIQDPKVSETEQALKDLDGGVLTRFRHVGSCSATSHPPAEANMEVAESNPTRPGDHMVKKHVFLSYCHDNESEVADLHADLVAAGKAVWWDKEILPGQDWKFEIRRAMKNAYAVVLCLLKESRTRSVSGIYPEALDAITQLREHAPGEIFLIPVRLSDCEIPPIEIDGTRTLDRIQYVDLFPHARRSDGLRKLIRAIQSSPTHPLSGSSLSSGAATVGQTEMAPSVPDHGVQQAGSGRVGDKRRRLDAATPSRAALGETIDVLIQARQVESPPLGMKDWPFNNKPESLQTDSKPVVVRFPCDAATGRILSAKLRVRIVAPDFVVQGPREKTLEVPPEGESEILSFLLKTKIRGACRINVEVSTIDKQYVGTVPVSTLVNGTPTSQQPTIASLVLVIVVPGQTVSPQFSQNTHSREKNAALAMWREKLEYLQKQEAIASDSAQKFTLKKLIEEAKTKIIEINAEQEQHLRSSEKERKRIEPGVRNNDESPCKQLSPQYKYDAFISYRNAEPDKSFARYLLKILEETGFKLAIDVRDFSPNATFLGEMERCVKESRFTVSIISPRYFQSGNTEEEAVICKVIGMNERKRRLMPLIIETSPMPTWLFDIVGIDFTASDPLVDPLVRLRQALGNPLPPPPPSPEPWVGRVRIAPTRLPATAETLVGRKAELKRLDKAWADPKIRVLTYIAWGGVGKTSLVAQWASRLAARNYDGARYFDWSFYNQGTHEQGAVSADAFIVEALKFFGDSAMAHSAASPWTKGKRLAQLIAQQRTLLVLDGLEPMQHSTGPIGGQLKDPALSSLLKGLAQQSVGLCLVTTRKSVADLKAFHASTAPEWPLDPLSIPSGVDLLKRLGVRGSLIEFELLVRDVKGHALTLNLLGRFLAQAHGGDVGKRDIVKLERADVEIQDRHAFRVMAAYEAWLSSGGERGERQLAVLRLLGLFDRPIDGGCMGALRRDPAIPGLTEPLVGLDEPDWNLTVSALSGCGLVFLDANGSVIDTHPLIREYFAEKLRGKNPSTWVVAHQRLCEYFQKLPPKHRPDSLEELEPLFRAIAHGCSAKMYAFCFDELYFERICGRNPLSFRRRFGAYSNNLNLVTNFVSHQWDTLVPGLSPKNSAIILDEAGMSLLALGRLQEARIALSSGSQLLLNLNPADDDTTRVASRLAVDLSKLQLLFGDIVGAIKSGERGVELANRIQDGEYQEPAWTTLANALHHAGRVQEAVGLFEHAEQMRRPKLPIPWMSEIRGYHYCDLLLTMERPTVVRERARWVLSTPTTYHLSATLHRLCLARTLSPTKPSDLMEMDQAVDDLRKDQALDYLPVGLLARGLQRYQVGEIDLARTDLDEAWKISKRGPMKLHQADILLSRARLFHDAKPYPWNRDEEGNTRGPKDDLAAARKLIEHCGYWRRKHELEDAEKAAKNWV